MKEIKTNSVFKKLMAEKFTKLRKKSGLTQQELADATSMSRASICNLESGIQGLTSYNIFIFSILFKCSPIEFFPTSVDYTPAIDYDYKSKERQRKIEVLEQKLKTLKSGI